MMTTKSSPTASIDQIIDDTLTVFEHIRQIPQMADTSIDGYHAFCRKIPDHIRSGQLKIAVVGVIKSGKSTFVNQLVGRELVKRGAGVITSITTRIRKGKKNQARLYFKSWDEINAQIQKALILFPGEREGNEKAHDFDIRRKKDRIDLEKNYQDLIKGFQVTSDLFSPEILLLRHALQGFEACKDLVEADEATICFESKAFNQHQAFTSDPDRAFYIKDVCLSVFGMAVDPNIEIADCQGVDSTDPSQLSEVLSYLESSNMIVYCISSRTGLRQSDILFLKRIQNLGLLDTVIFINNCDLTEHENLEDLIKIETHIQEHLEFLNIQPRLFSISFLYNLFLKRSPKLPKRDLSRLKLWQEEKKMVQYCDLKTDEFISFFNGLIDKKRKKLLISNYLKRLGVIITELNQRTNIFLDLVSSDKSKEEAAKQTIAHLHQNASRVEAIAANSIEGAVQGLKEQIGVKIKEMFVRDEEKILKKTQGFVQTASIDVESYRIVSKTAGFNQIFYFMFQDFQRKLDVYIIEEVNPAVKKFVMKQEQRIKLYFQSLFDAYQIDRSKTDPYSEFEAVSISVQQLTSATDSVDIEKIKKILGLQIPGRIFEAKYTSGIKTNVFADFSLQTVSQIFSSLFRKKAGFSFSPGLEKAVKKIKMENYKLLKNQFLNYHAALRTHYFLPLIEAAARDFKEKLDERFSRYHFFNQEMEQFFLLKESEKKEQQEKIILIKKRLEQIAAEVSSLI